MLSGSKALEFLGGQGITALGNLVLSRRDSLLLDVRSTVPAEKVACLNYSDLSSSSGLFPTPLLDSALTKMCAASNDALVQRTLHPPKIPQKSLARPVKAGSSSTVVAPQSQESTAPPLLPSRVGRGGVTRVRLPFLRSSVAPAATGASEKGPGKSPPDGVLPLLQVGGGGCLSAHWQAIGAESWVLSVLRDGYRIPFKDSPPPLACTPISFPTYRAGSPQALVMRRQEVEKMLSKDALEIVLDPGPGFYSRLFLV